MYAAGFILIEFLMDISLLGEQTKSAKLVASLGELMAKKARHKRRCARMASILDQLGFRWYAHTHTHTLALALALSLSLESESLSV